MKEEFYQEPFNEYSNNKIKRETVELQLVFFKSITKKYTIF